MADDAELVAAGFNANRLHIHTLLHSFSRFFSVALPDTESSA
jgi:hypothetical protein